MPGRVLRGVVENNTNDKTVVVRVERRFMTPLFKKTIRRSKRYHAHDPDNRCKKGEAVVIRECRPISKMKSWEVIFDAPAEAKKPEATP